MNNFVQNFIKEISSTKKETFTKEDIINIINNYIQYNRPEKVESNGVMVDPESCVITINGKPIKTPNKVFQLLYYFISNKNKNITREKILNDVWGRDVCVVDRTVDVHIRKIRKLLPKNFIRTNKNFGYIWDEK